PDGDGFEILDAMGSLDFVVFFTTAYGDYREKAFDYFSLHYLLKPIDVDRLEQAIARLKKRQHRSLDRMQLSMLRQVIESDLQLIALPEHNGYSLEAINDIVRCEAQGNYTAVYMKGGKKYLCARTMKHFDQTFQGHLFFRIHKSHLVNVRYVRQIQQGGEIVLEDNTRLPLSQRSRNLFLKFVQQTSNLSL
ncbi:MAG: LytTR family DNA-binding domain-containing protein, partial [Bacteroidota bacterium]